MSAPTQAPRQHSEKYLRKRTIKRMEQKENKISDARKDFVASLKLCKQYMAAYERTKDQTKLAKAQEIFKRDLVGEPGKYNQIMRPEMRLKFLELVEKGNVFKMEKSKFGKYDGDFLANLEGDGWKPQFSKYEDLIGMYVNLIEKDHPLEV